MIKELPDQLEMQRAMLARDASFDGIFFVCVKTTKIFCRPSCPARKPKPENVVYHPAVRDCLLAGFRPCKRCRPLATAGRHPDWVETLIERVEQDPSGRFTDADLRGQGVSPFRARRYFNERFGMTFHAYHRARRMGLALGALREGDNALHVAFDHGFESNSGFRDAFERTFGTTPGRCAGVTPILSTTIESPIGPLVAGATEEGVCLLEFADRRAFQHQVDTLRRRLGGTIVPGLNEHLAQLRRELTEYFEARRTVFTVPLVAPGTDFQRRVWRALGEIPYGQTRSYDELATAIGRPGAHRAVGRANGDNRLAILIPCHRVVRSDGHLCGYGGGLWRKRHLLELERSRHHLTGLTRDQSVAV